MPLGKDTLRPCVCFWFGLRDQIGKSAVSAAHVFNKRFFWALTQLCRVRAQPAGRPSESWHVRCALRAPCGLCTSLLNTTPNARNGSTRPLCRRLKARARHERFQQLHLRLRPNRQPGPQEKPRRSAGSDATPWARELSC